MKRGREIIFWLLVLGLALVANLLTLEARGLWQDEGLTLYQIRLPIPEILEGEIPVAQFNTQNTVPPFYFLLAGLWGRAVGFSIWGIRLFSVFAALAALPAIYYAGRAMVGPRVGRIAALLAAISPLLRWYAQEMRMYSLMVLLAALSMAFLWKSYEAWERHAPRPTRLAWMAAYLTPTVALVWTHYLSLLLLAAQLLWMALILFRAHPRRTLLLVALVGAATVPLLPFGWKRLQSGPERDFFFFPLGRLLVDLLNGFAFGLSGFTSKVEEIWFLLPLVGLLVLVGAWRAYRRQRDLALFLVVQGTVPAALIYALSYVKPIYQNPRHLIVMLPAFLLLWAIGLEATARWRRSVALVAILLLSGGWLVASARYYDDPSAQKNDVRPLFETLAARWAPGDVIALNDPIYQHVLEYFAPDVPWVALPPYGVPLTDATAEPAYRAMAEAHERVWYVYGPPDSATDSWRHPEAWLQRHATWIDGVRFRGQTLVGADLYDLAPRYLPLDTAPALPAAVPFGEGLTFRGLLNAPESARSGASIHLDSLWLDPAAQLPAMEDVALRLADGYERFWPLPTRATLGPAASEIADHLYRVPIEAELPPDLPPGEYQIELSLVAAGGELRTRSDQSGLLLVAPLVVGRPATPPPVEGAVAGNIRVQSPALDERVAPGVPIPFAFRVRVERADGWPGEFELAWVDEAGEVAARQRLPLAGGSTLFPPSEWQVGDAFELRYLLITPTLPAGRYRLRMSALGPEGALPFTTDEGARAPQVGMGAIEITDRVVRRAPPPVAVAVAAEWSGAVELVGYSVRPDPPSSAEPLAVQLVWQAEGATDRPYKVFLHLVNEAGEVVTADAFFEVPSVAWRANEYLLSEHFVAPGALPPGRYTLRVGLYEEATGARFVIEAPESAVTLGEVELR